MRTVVVSDLHMGADSDLAIFAGTHALPRALIGLSADGPLRVILNGDTFDFLLDDEALELDEARICARTREIAASTSSAPVIQALAQIAKSGGEVRFRPGNHDLEMDLPGVRATISDVLVNAGAPRELIRFDDGLQPLILEDVGSPVLVCHGEQADPFNMWDRARLRAAADRSPGQVFEYPPGSLLVKRLLNPLKRRMRFLDLLKPDFRGAVLAALAVDPLRASMLISPTTIHILLGVIANITAGAAFGPIDGDDDRAHYERLLSVADLDDAELRALSVTLDSGAPQPFGISDVLVRVHAKLLRAGSAGYRAVVGSSGAAFFDHEPNSDEWSEVRRLSEKYDVRTVVMGHTHARRFARRDDLTYINTGTWIWLMSLPAHDAPLSEWEAFLGDLRADPHLDGVAASRRLVRGSACLLDNGDCHLVTFDE